MLEVLNVMAEAEICGNSTPVYYSRIEPLKAKYTGVAKIGSVKVKLLWMEKILLKCQLTQHMDHCET